MDDAFNAGDRSDRIEVRWDLRSPRVEAAIAGALPETEAEGAGVLLDRDPEGLPLPRPGAKGRRLVVWVPPDYLDLRARDRAAAAAWRDASGDALAEAFERRYVAVDFLPDGRYLLERPDG
jgi:predicted GNAT superfamily acetyltransferase